MTKLKEIFGEELKQFKAKYKTNSFPLIDSEKVKKLCDCITSTKTTPLNDTRKAISLIQGDRCYG